MTMDSAIQRASEGATARLGEWTAGLRYEAIPEKVREHVKLCILDGIGCGLFGSRQPWGRIAADVAEELSGPGPSCIWGTPRKSGPAAAALVNGTALHGFELDDVHLRSLIHPGAVTIPAVLAVAEARRLSGRDCLTAIVAGYEVGLRVGICAGVPHGLRGYHPTGTVGCLCSSAAVASLLALAPTEAMHALAIGATQAAGLYAARTGAMAKRLHAGRAAESGVIAGVLAERGFTGCPEAIEARFGGFLSTLSEDTNVGLLTGGLGEHWETLDVGFKAYAACASAHTIIDALDRLMQRGLRADQLTRLRIRMTKIGVNNVGWPYRPGGVVAAQMNGFYTAAVKLLDGEAFIEQYSEDRLGDPRIRALIEKIEIVHDPALDAGGAAKRHAVTVEARLTDGRVWEEHVEQRRGSPQHPMSRGELQEKFRRTAARALAAPTIDHLLNALLSIEEVQHVDRIGSLLAGGAK